ncbi:MAG TPA: amidohydrolase [Thermodesulfobacteriota bacterium]|nr:amidohydrolase [Thermodesulfobacteriota bacterium]
MHNGLHPEVIYINGNVVTLDPSRPQAEAVATWSDKIAAVGSNDELKQMAGPETGIVDLAGRTLVPGLIEPHNHFILYGPMALIRVDLSSPPMGRTRNIKELLEALKEKAGITPKGSWISGYGYDDTLLEEQRHPSRSELDQVSTDHPIFISHTSMHMVTGNSLALSLAGINRDSPSPEGGVIRKDPNTGEPDGLLEEAAQMILYQALPTLTLEQRMALLALGADHFLKVGVASLVDAGVAFPGRVGAQDILLYQKAVGDGSLPIRISMMIEAGFLLNQCGGFLSGFGSERLRMGPAKIVADGSIQGYTGWLTKPYHTPFKGDPDYRGYPVISPEPLKAQVMELHKAGYQIAVHANGDATIDAAIEAFRLAQEAYPRQDTRHRIEHCQMVREDQLDAIAELGISPSFFVSHTYYWGDRHRAIFMGPERAARISPLKSALKRGIRFSIHSDCPVTPVSPLFCVNAAVNRKTSSGYVLGPEFRLTPEEALRAVTLDAAYQTFEENLKGSIEKGKLADFTLLEQNPLKVPPEEIKNIKVSEVIIGGKQAYASK